MNKIRSVSNIEALFNFIPDIIIYVVVGYLFNKVFSFVALKKFSSNVEHVVISSFVIGYIYCTIIHFIPIHISYEVDSLGISASAIVLAYLVGKFWRSKYMLYLLDFLKIRDTVNLYYWDDLMDDIYPMKVVATYKDIVYEGMLYNYESYSNAPELVLSSYIIKDKNGATIKDYTHNKTKCIILNSGNAENIEIVYSDKSDKCNDIKSLCDSNDALF